MAALMVRRVLPTYPELDGRARVSGAVRQQGTLAKNGHPLLVAAAVEALRQWICRPALLNREPVEVIAPIDVNFTLGGN